MRTPLRQLAVCGGSISLLLATAYIGAADAAAPLPCGTVITANTTLQNNIGPCSGDGVIVGADNVTLNLNGYEIFGTPGPGNGTQAGIRLPFRTGVSIVGKKQKTPSAGTVRDFDAGVFINGGGSNNIRDLVVRDNIGPLDSNSFLGDGIVLFHSASNKITDNVVTHNGRFDGIGVWGLGSNGNTIQGNTVDNNVGIPEGASPEVGPGEVPHYINAPGHGIIVNHFLDQPVGSNEPIFRNNVMNNIVRGNDGSGISTVANMDAVIIGNFVEGNAPQYYGNFYRLFGTYPPSSVVGIGVTTGPGLLIERVPHNVLVRNNVVNHNALVGINIQAGGNQVLDNQVFDNGSWGINSDYETRGNSILNNRTGGNLMVDLFDQTGDDQCVYNRWWRNTHSAELQPLGIEFGFPAPYYPACTADGPNGKGPRARLATPDAMPGVAGQQQPRGRAFSGR